MCNEGILLFYPQDPVLRLYGIEVNPKFSASSIIGYSQNFASHSAFTTCICIRASSFE